MSPTSLDPDDATPWVDVEEALERGDVERLRRLIDELPEPDLLRAVGHLPEATQGALLAALPPRDAADLVEEIPSAQAANALQHLEPDRIALILHELRSDERTDFISELDEEEAAEVLALLPPDDADDVRALADYEEGTVGSLMFREYLRYTDDQDVASVVEDLRAHAARYARYDVQYSYVVDTAGRLVGVLRMRDLLLSEPGATVASIMIAAPLSLFASDEVGFAADRFEGRSFLALPVVDEGGLLLGVVRRYLVEEALTDRAEADHLKSVGIVGGEELRSMPLLHRSSRRLSWLSINIVLNVIAASVIAMFEETLSAVIALAFFLPIISDMSGCSGNQAVAVSIRELSLGLVRPSDVLWVWVRELGVGLLNGTALGVLIGVVAWLWRGNAWLGGVIGLALFCNTLIAVSVGGGVPLLLKRFGIDPALASGPLLTTMTDICGFLLVLGLATLALPQLI